MHASDVIIDSVELISLGQSDISPMLEKVKIKVFYLGANRNGSYIDKPTALNMAKTLRGCPIVGYFREEKDDFTDHGEAVTIDDQGIHFNCNTKPYGFVDLNAQIWFENYIDLDEFGNGVERTYLVTEGVVWSGQYPEIAKATKEGRPHSMELDEETLQGHWADDYKSGAQIFIINDAIFSKLCILGEDVEPCFEGSSITSPEVSSTFTADNKDFVTTLFTMVQQLKELTYSLQDKGGTQMEENKQEIAATPVEENSPAPAEEFEKIDEVQGESVEETSPENEIPTEEFAKEEEKEEDSEEKSEEDSEDDSKEEEKEEEPKKNHTLEEKFALLEQKFAELEKNYTALEEENAKLLSFKNEVEEQKKDDLINSFYMLSDEDKKDVIENKSKYSLEDIEAKLSIICVRKKVNFNLEEEGKKQEQPAITFNLNEADGSDVPAWLRAVEDRKKNEA